MIEGNQIKVELLNLQVFGANINAVISVVIAKQWFFFQGHTTFVGVPGIIFDSYINHVPRYGGFFYQIAVMVAMTGENDFRSKCTEWFAIHPDKCFVAANMRADEKVLPRKVSRNGVARSKPAVGALPAPAPTFFNIRKKGSFRYVMELFERFKSGTFQFADFFKNKRLDS